MSLNIVHTDRGFEVSFKYDPYKVNDMKSIRGAYFRAKDKTWVIPAYREREVEMLKKKYGIMINPVIDMPQQVGEIPELEELDFEVPLNRESYHFQSKGIKRGTQLKRFINGDAPGLGKTQQAIGTAVALNCKCILVICPKTLMLNWQKEWMEVAGRKAMILGDRNKSSWQMYQKIGLFDVFIVNYESLKKFFVAAGWKPKKSYMIKDIPFRECIELFDCVIVDECHRVKDTSTRQCKLTVGICISKPVRIGLTGTPLINKPRDIIGQLTVVGRLAEVVSHIPYPVDQYGKATDLSGYNRFLNRYCEGGNGACNLRELNYRLNRLCFFRREKMDVLPDLPEKLRQIVLCDITNRKEYDMAEYQFIKYLKEIKQCTDAQVKRKLRGQMMVKMGVLKQIAAKGKLEAAQEYISEVADSGEKIVVFCHLKEIVNELKQLYPNAVTVVGDDSQEERDRAIYEFQNNPDVKEIICSLGAGSEGITLTAAWEVLLLEQPWTDAKCEQAIDRTHRIGQINRVRAGFLLGKDTIDEYCYTLILKKRDLARLVTGSTDNSVDEIVDDMLKFFGQRLNKPDDINT